MKTRFHLFIAFGLAWASALGQQVSDSIEAGINLQEVVIQAPKVIRKADMDVYHPSQSAIEHSKAACNCCKIS